MTRPPKGAENALTASCVPNSGPSVRFPLFTFRRPPFRGAVLFPAQRAIPLSLTRG